MHEDVLISDYRVWTKTLKNEEWIRTCIVPYTGVNFCNECFQEPKYEVRMDKFKQIGTRLYENQWIILQLSLWGVAFTIKSVFLFELLKLKMYEAQWIIQQMQKWEFKMKISPALK